MIDHERRAHWDVPTNRAPHDWHDIADSLPYPFEGFEWMFYGKDVLEVGPGRGRQYERIKKTCGTYRICDISPAALLEPVFADVGARYLLWGYNDDFGCQFDVIHFWYVLHHVKRSELGDFFAFIARHLRRGGVALFNSPQTDKPEEWYAGDGIGTTMMSTTEIRAAYALGAVYAPLVTEKMLLQETHSSGHVFVVRKT